MKVISKNTGKIGRIVMETGDEIEVIFPGLYKEKSDTLIKIKEKDDGVSGRYNIRRG